MTNNPYQSPSSRSPAGRSRVVGIKSGKREDLKSVALYQKVLIYCIVVYLIAVFGYFVMGTLNAPGPFMMIFAPFGFIAGITGTVFVFLLATKVYSTGVGIGLGVLCLIPCIGLVVLLVVNGKATGILKQNKIKVGMLGANLSKI